MRRGKRAEVALAHRALHDPLTQLPNRALLMDRLGQALRQVHQGGSVALLLLDLDRFKEVNSTLGHDVGDQLLRDVAWRLRAAAPGAATVARVAGDEFALVLPATGGADAVLVGRAALAAVPEPLVARGQRIPLEASLGVAVGPEHGVTPEQVLRHAVVAMQHAKRAGEPVAIYSPRLDRQSPERLALLAELREALAAGELVLHYQPKLELVTGRLAGLEALVRWEHPRRGLLEPAEFVPLAESTGLVAPVTHWVLEASLRQQHQWRTMGMDLPLAVNLSARMLSDPELPERLARLLRTWETPAGSLYIELTESALIVDRQRAERSVAALHALGVGVSIDDFGTGYSSLAYITDLAVDEVKIDRSFVCNLASDPHSRAVVRAIIDLAHDLELLAVAEGVEDGPTWELLGALGCDLAQGYYISPALPAAELQTWVSQAARWSTAEHMRVGLEAKLRERTERQHARLVAEEEFLARKRAEAALQQSEESRRLALEAGRLGTWEIDPARQTISWTPEAEALFGLPPGTADGTVAQLQALVHPDDWKILSEDIKQRATSGGDSAVVYRVVWPDGSVHWLEGRARGLRAGDGVVARLTGTVMDVTERKQAEEERARLAAIVTASDVGIFACGLDGTVVTWNRGAELVYGYTAEDIIGQSVTLLAPPERAEEIAQLLSRVAGGTSQQQFETVHLRHDATLVDVSLNLSPIYDTARRITGAAIVLRDITARRTAQAALREREAQLAEAQRIAHIGSWELDVASGRFRWSDEHFRLVGLEPAPSGVPEIDVPSIIHPEDRVRAQAVFNDMLSRRSSYAGDMRFVRADGTVRWVHSRGAYRTSADGSHDRVVGTAQDITERVESERERARLDAHVQSLLSSTSEGIYGIDTDGRCTFINTAGAALLGYSPGELVGQLMHERVHSRRADGSPCPETDCPVHLAMRSAQSCRVDTDVLWRRDGTTLPVELVANPLLDDGRVIGVVVAFQDITERKEAERQRELLAQGEKLRALGQMASGIAHDLNQSLMLIASYADLTQRALECDPPDLASVREFTMTAVQAAVDGGETLKRLLAFTRRPSVNKHQLVDLNGIAREAVQLTAPRWRDATQVEGRPVDLKLDEEGQAAVEGSPSALREVLTNLIFNAVDALPSGGSIRVRVATDQNTAILEVSDSGMGMTPEVQARIFEPFFTTKGDSGTGLGLSMVFGIVEQHAGHISVRSAPGVGTTIHVTLPRAAPAALVSTEAQRPSRLEPQLGLRILAVDDEPAITRAMMRMLRPAGHQVTIADSAEEALDKLAVDRFDVVVSDLGLGAGMNGWDLAAAVHARWPGTRFILATGWGAAIDAGSARGKGVDAVLAKPYRLAELNHALAGSTRTT